MRFGVSVEDFENGRPIDRFDHHRQYIIEMIEKIHIYKRKLRDFQQKFRYTITYVSAFVIICIMAYNTFLKYYDEYKDKTLYELYDSFCVYIYVIIASYIQSLAGQTMLKDAYNNTMEYYNKQSKSKKQNKIDDESNKIDPLILEKYNAVIKLVDKDTGMALKELIYEDDIKDSSLLMSYINFITDEYPQEAADMNVITDIVKKLETLVSSYDNEIGNLLDTNVVNPLLLTMLPKEDPTIQDIPISPIYLVGPPGVGKTRFVQNLAKLLDTKYFTYDPSREQKQFDYTKTIEKNFENLSVFTQIRHFSMNNPYLPPILFLDEFDKSSSNMFFLLELLGDSSKKRYIDNVFSVRLNLPNNLLIICAANISLDQLAKKNYNMAPFKSRFIEITFPNMSNEIQMRIAMDYIKTMRVKIDEEDKEFIKEVINKSNFAGAREIVNVINVYAQQLQSTRRLSSIGKKIISMEDYRKQYLKDINKGKDTNKSKKKDSEYSDSEDGDYEFGTRKSRKRTRKSRKRTRKSRKSRKIFY